MNDEELEEDERALNDAHVSVEPQLINGARFAVAALGALALAALASSVLGVKAMELTVAIGVVAVPVIYGATTKSRGRELELRPEGIADLKTAPRITLLPYADVDSVTREYDVVVVQAPGVVLRLKTTASLVHKLERYLEAQVARARAVDDDRRTVEEFLARAATEDAPNYRQAAPPTSALEAIARARGMPVRLRLDAARAAALSEEEIDVTEELKATRPMSEE